MEIIENEIIIRLGNVSHECYFAFNHVENKPVYLSKAIKNLSGLDADTVEKNPMRFWKMVHAEDQTYLQKAIKTLLKSGYINAEFRILKGKAIKHLQANAYLIEGNLIVGNVADITDLKNNMFYAEKINARKNAMLAILAHDLKEPVGVINMMASAIKRNPAAADNNDILDNIKVIQDLCARNITLINDLINKEFLEAPEVGLRKERTNMNKALADLVKQYQNSQSVIEKSFELVVPEHLVFATVDMLKIAQCVNNLIANAIKFTPVGGRIVVLLNEKESNVEIRVQDNGIGIPADLQPYLFDERTRAHRPGLRGEHGFGMGLSIIRLLVKLHGGRVWVDSTEGKGCTFGMEFPK